MSSIPPSAPSPDPSGHSAGPAPTYVAPSGGHTPKNGFGIAALVLGIVGILLSFIPVVGIFLPLILGLIGVILGILGISRARKGIATNRTMSIIGTILSALAILAGIIALILSIAFVNSVNKAIEESSNDPVATATSEAPESESSAPAAEEKFPGQMEKDVVGDAGAELTVSDIAITSGPLTQQSGVVGDVYCTDVTATNNGSETLSGFGSYSFKVQNPSGAATDATFAGIDNELQSADLAPGGTASGAVCFDANQVAPGQNVVIFQDLLSFDDARGAWINNL